MDVNQNLNFNHIQNIIMPVTVTITPTSHVNPFEALINIIMAMHRQYIPGT
jgi:hypothetical protein